MFNRLPVFFSIFAQDLIYPANQPIVMSKKEPLKTRLGDNIIKNLLLIAATGLLLILLTLLFLNFYTRHGQQVVIPSLEGLQANEANTLLQAKGLHAEIVDSVYYADGVPGAIIDQTPKAGNKVKEGRAIYVTIYSRTPQMVAVPGLVDYSTRQAMALLTSMGFSQIAIEEIPSEYAGLVVAVKFRGRALTPEEKVPASSPLTLVITKAFEEDSLIQDNTNSLSPGLPDRMGNDRSGEGAIDDTFF